MRDVVIFFRLGGVGGGLLCEDELAGGPTLRLDNMSLQRRNLPLFDLEL